MSTALCFFFFVKLVERVSDSLFGLVSVAGGQEVR